MSAAVRFSHSFRNALLNAALDAAKDALGRLRQLADDGFAFDKVSFHPGLDPNAPGRFPKLKGASSADKPAHYAGVFGNSDRYGVKYRYSELVGFDALIARVKSNDQLSQFLWPNRGDAEWREHILRVQVAELPLATAERNIAVGGFDVDESVLATTGTAILNWWMWEDVPIEVVVPILNIDFDSDRFDLDGVAHVERIEDGLQLARWPGHSPVTPLKARGHIEKCAGVATFIVTPRQNRAENG
jgi:hypothetical protein